MKLNRSKLLLITILTVLLLGLNSCVVGQELQIDTENQLSSIIQTSSLISTQYDAHSPISIDGNADFLTQANAENWPGDGTPSNPIVIDELNITGPSESVLIKINSTDLHFQISNCILGEGMIGIDLDYISNGIIEKNIIYNNNDIGITVWVSQNITIISNSIFANDRDGILLYYSDDNIVQKNSIYNNNHDGIRLLYADFTVIRNNIIHNNSVAGHGGILLRGTQYTVVTGNTIFNNGWYGVWLHNDKTASIISNSIYNHSAQGIRIFSSNNAQIIGNTLNNNDIGIMLYETNNAFINSNTINNGVEHGIHLSSSSNNSVTWNDLKGNNPTGFFLGNLQAFDSGSDNVFIYNYWDDWTSPDVDEDGIVDDPHPIDGSANNQDPSPLAFIHVLTKFSITYPNGGETLKGTVNIQWTASSDSWGHQLIYSVYSSADRGKTWNQLDVGLTTTSCDWDTSTVVNGPTYLVKVVATCSEGIIIEDISDGLLTIQNVEITTTTTPSWTLFLLLLSLFIMRPWRLRKKKS